MKRCEKRQQTSITSLTNKGDRNVLTIFNYGLQFAISQIYLLLMMILWSIVHGDNLTTIFDNMCIVLKWCILYAP